MQLGQIQPKKAGGPGKEDKVSEAFEQGLQIPWMGLRPDLMLHKGAPDENCKTTYILEDPVRGEHFELGESEAKLFLCLAAEKDLKSAVDRLMKTTSLRPSVKDVLSFVQMLQYQKLAILPEGVDPTCSCKNEPEPEAEEEDKKSLGTIRKIFTRIFWGIFFALQYIWWYLQRFKGGEGASKPPPGQKQTEEQKKASGGEPGFSLRSIYFFRIPIIRPDSFLTALYPWVSPLWSKPFLYVYGVLGLAGLISVIQQFELYLHTASYIFTFKGALMFTLCLCVLKLMHEFGHALATKHYGIFVRRMGIYMMFFMPMLYTDATDAWKLPSKKARLMIGAAGVLVELYAGMIALFLWGVLPDGILRSVMFYTSGAAIISTLIVNISPFMRFDGYYVLMDYLGMSNLRSRSMLMYKYYIRRLAVDWQGPKPEEHPRGPFMAIFGLGCSLYLIVVVFGIQYMIYTEISELLAIWGMTILFLVFVAGPLVSEIAFIFKNYDQWGSKGALSVRALIFALIGAFLFVPTQTSEMVPAFFLFQDVTRLEAPGRGRIVTDIPQVNTSVQKGEVLVRIEDDFLEQELKRSHYALAQVEESLKNTPAGGLQGGYRKWLLAEQQRLTAKHNKLRQSVLQLEIRSPITGRIADRNKELQKGSYTPKKGYVLTVADARFSEVQAYVAEKTYRSLKGNEDTIASLSVVVPDLEADPIKGKFREMLDFPVTEFPNNSLFDFAEGPIVASTQARPSESGSLQPRDPHFPIFFDISDPPDYLRHGTPCFVNIKGETVSLMGLAAREVYRLLATRKIIATFQ
ncbi:HlyD family efflux transporter periplasmic adaptor subunit [Desulfococcaceae bacterium HSG8]|nr:HlyD family efflux transporter periplasmic adaptor subunit [Desulfococcaceae bacterium HSG8]